MPRLRPLPLLVLGLLVGGVVVLGGTTCRNGALRAPDTAWLPHVPWTADADEEQEVVVVFVVEGAGAVAQVAGALDPERLVRVAPRWILVDGRRVVAADLDAAAAALAATDLADGPVELWSARAVSGSGTPVAPAPGEDRIRSLAQRPTLSLGEALALLEELER